jgi:LEA14-like dessication related protein
MHLISTSSVLLLLFLILQSAGCKNIKELDYKGIQNTHIENIGLNNTAIRIDLGYYNPNNFWLDVKETNLSIYLDDTFIGLADQPTKTRIPKNADFTFPVVAHFNPLKIIGNSLGALLKNKGKLGIRGTAKVGKGGIYMKVPIAIEEEVKILKN